MNTKISTTDHQYYLAYGSNINMEQMSSRCPNAYPVGKAFIEGYRLSFKGSCSGSYLTIEKAKNHRVPVIVWKVDAHDIANLDRYEGYPVFYDIKTFDDLEVEPFVGESTKLNCFAYVMVGSRSYGVPSRHYVDCCARGYERFGLNIDYLTEALNYTGGKLKHDSVHRAGSKGVTASVS